MFHIIIGLTRCSMYKKYDKVPNKWSDQLEKTEHPRQFPILKLRFVFIRDSNILACSWAIIIKNAMILLHIFVFIYYPLLTVYLNFTKIIVSIEWIIDGKRRMSPVVVVDDVSPMVRTADVDRVSYRDPFVIGVSETQHSFISVCCIWQYNEKPSRYFV